MAQPGLLINHQNNENFLNNDFETNEAMSSNETTDKFQCTYFRRRTSKISDKIKTNKDNKTSSDSSIDKTDNESESESIANVLRWLQSLPKNLTKRESLEEITNSSKFQEIDRNLYKLDTRIDDRGKSLESSLKRKSTYGVPLVGKNNMLLEINNKKVEFRLNVENDETCDELDGTGKKSLKRKLSTENKKSSIKSSVSKLSKKSGKSDLHSMKTISRQSLISIENNQRILKNVSVNKIKERIQSNVTNNKRLLYILKNIINVIDTNDLLNQKKNVLIKNSKRKKNAKCRICRSNNINKFGESRTERPIFKNPIIQKAMDDAMKKTLKKYVIPNTWNWFEENDIVSNDEPPVKKNKRMIPSLASANSLNPYVLI